MVLSGVSLFAHSYSAESWRPGRNPGKTVRCTSTDLVVDALLRPTVQALDDINIAAANADERSSLVLAILEFTLLMVGKRRAEGRRHLLTEGSARIEGKELHSESIVHPSISYD